MAIGSIYSDALESAILGTGTPVTFPVAKTNETRAKATVIPFIWTAASEASGTTVNLAVIPKGARILYGEFGVSASFGSTTLAMGVAGKDNNGYYDDALEAGTRLDNSTAVVAGTPVADSTTGLKAAATATDATAKVNFAATTALGYLYEAKKDLYLTMTTGAATAGTAVLRGYVLVAID